MPRISRPCKHPQYWKVTAWAQEHRSVCASTWWLIKGGHFPESFAKVRGKQLTYLSRFHPCVCVSSLSRYADVFKQSQHTHFVVFGLLGESKSVWTWVQVVVCLSVLQQTGHLSRVNSACCPTGSLQLLHDPELDKRGWTHGQICYVFVNSRLDNSDWSSIAAVYLSVISDGNVGVSPDGSTIKRIFSVLLSDCFQCSLLEFESADSWMWLVCFSGCCTVNGA